MATNKGIDSSEVKVIVWASVIIVFTVGLIILWNYIKKQQQANKEANDLKSEIKTKNLTFSQSEFNGMANSLWAAIADSVTEDEDLVIRIVNKLKSADDWRALQLTFNQKYADTSSFWQKGDLSFWIAKKTPEIIPQINESLSKFGESI